MTLMGPTDDELGFQPYHPPCLPAAATDGTNC